MTKAMTAAAALQSTGRDDAEIDFDKVVNDPVYRRRVIQRLNTDASSGAGLAGGRADDAVSENRISEEAAASHVSAAKA